MVEQDLPLGTGLDSDQAPALTASPSAWLACVLDSFDAFLRDHASCEKKASGMALNMASHYPDQPKLLDAMVDLAVEELNHYREVIRIMLARNIVPGADQKDPYINQLNHHVRKGPANFLLDRLLIAAVVERRGAERFGLVADALIDPGLKKFYQAIAASEARHWTLFYELAQSHGEHDEVAPRFAELNLIEGEIMQALPIKAALH